jgi:hypothetical protein
MVTGLPIAGILAAAAAYVTILAVFMHVHGTRQMLVRRRYKSMPPRHNRDAMPLRMGCSDCLVTPRILAAFLIIIRTKVV